MSKEFDLLKLAIDWKEKGYILSNGDIDGEKVKYIETENNDIVAIIFKDKIKTMSEKFEKEPFKTLVKRAQDILNVKDDEEIKLSKREYILLKSLDKKYAVIERAVTGDLYVSPHKPCIPSASNSIDELRSIFSEVEFVKEFPYDHLFKFIKNGDWFYISKLLEKFVKEEIKFVSC